MNGDSDECIKTVRIAKLEDIQKNNLIENRPLFTEVITLDRTDNQSVYYKELWKSNKYIDLNDR